MIDTNAKDVLIHVHEFLPHKEIKQSDIAYKSKMMKKTIAPKLGA